MKFIKLHSYYGPNIIIVAVDAIDAIFPTDDDGNTQLTMRNGKLISVKETQEEILKLIKEIK